MTRIMSIGINIQY